MKRVMGQLHQYTIILSDQVVREIALLQKILKKKGMQLGLSKLINSLLAIHLKTDLDAQERKYLKKCLSGREDMLERVFTEVIRSAVKQI